MTFFRSIRARFTGWYLIILAILLVGLGISLHAFLSFTLQRTQDLALESRASQLASSPEARIAINEGRIEAGLGEVVGFFVASDEGYQIISTRPIEQDLDLTWIDAAFSGNPGFYTVATRDGALLRFYIALMRSRTGVPPPLGSQPQSRPNNDVIRDAPAESLALAVVVIGQPMDRTVAALAALRNTLLIAIPLTLLLSAGGGLFLVRKALKPIDRMIETTRGIEEADLGGRVAVESDDELGRLARTLNAMLGRLERAFNRQRQFTDDASHELRSPLSVIAAEATLALRREREASDYRESLSVIAEESVTMNRLIDQLLTLARADAGAEEIEYQQIDLSKLIIEAIAVMQPLAEEKRLKLSVKSSAQEGSAIRVTGDETQLKRVLTNLIENAIRHTEPDGEITVSAARSGSTIEWRIVDTGCGISEEHLPHVFERFYRADKARSRQEGGSGLGLSICRLIVEAHHGVIAVESEVNVGTTFLIQLPSV